MHIDGGIATCDNISILNNIISGNGHFSGTLPSTFASPTYFATGNGINAVNNCTGLIIRGNSIGLGADGVTALGNTENGISLANIPSVIIGGSRANANERNIISKHGFHGINLYQSNNFSIKGNIIGTNAGLTLDYGNQDSGILSHGSNTGTIGGSGVNDGNILVNSKEEYGIRLQITHNVVIQGNYIGTNIGGTTDMGNLEGGIYLVDYGGGCYSNTVGASTTIPLTGEANVIAYNKGPGVTLENVATLSPVRGNSIYCNTAKGISLLTGGNINKPAPAINDVPSPNSLSGTAQANDIIHIYTNPLLNCGTCQGKVYIGTTTANGSGLWSYTHNLGLSTVLQRLVTATATDVSNNTSEFATCIVLPVEFISFTATKTGRQQALLQWSTATETNNNYFVLERSTDGKNWSPIGTINGAGNSQSILSYSFSDENALPGINYYRIKQVDVDNQWGLSVQKYVNFNTELSISIFPNPAENELFVQVLNLKGKVTIELIDALGQLVLVQQNENIQNTLDVSSLAKGIYFATVRTENYFVKMEKVVIQ
jgi:hypothetical protein